MQIRRLVLVPTIAALASAALALPAGAVPPAQPPNATPNVVNVSAQADSNPAVPGKEGVAGHEAEVEIAVNPKDPKHQVIAGHAATNSFATLNTFVTTDGGQTWTFIPLGAAEDGYAAADTAIPHRFDPAVAFDRDGNVYVVYGVTLVAKAATPTTPAQPARTAIVVARSGNGGRTKASYTFTTVDVAPDTAASGNDRWVIETARNPNNLNGPDVVHLFWTRNNADGSQWVMTRVSRTTNPLDFFAAIRVHGGTAPGTLRVGKDAGAGPNGEVYVAWHECAQAAPGSGLCAAAPRSIWVSKSTNGGGTYTAEEVVTNLTLDRVEMVPSLPTRGIRFSPTIDVDRSTGPNRGRVYLAWNDAGTGPNPLANNDTDIKLRSRGPADAAWTAPITVNRDPLHSQTQALPRLSVDDGTGLVSVFWLDTANDDFNDVLVEPWGAVSTDGKTFLPDFRIAGQADARVDALNYLEYNGLATRNCVMYPAWPSNLHNRTQTFDYYTAQVRVTCPVRTFDTNNDGKADLTLRDTDGDGFLEWPDGKTHLPGTLHLTVPDKIEFQGNPVIEFDTIIIDEGVILSNDAGKLNKFDMRAFKGGITSRGTIDITANDDVFITAYEGNIDLRGPTRVNAADQVIVNAVLHSVILNPPHLDAMGVGAFAIKGGGNVSIKAKGFFGFIDIARARVGGRTVTLDNKAALSNVHGDKGIFVSGGSVITTDRARTGGVVAASIALYATGQILVDSSVIDSAVNVSFVTYRTTDDLCLAGSSIVDANNGAGRIYVTIKGKAYVDAAVQLIGRVSGTALLAGPCP